MFRECYFEYAGQSSQPYNLMLVYVSNSTSDFDSGGKFDLKTGTLPRSYETLLYGKDYSAQPLEFDVEFVNLHGAIPLEQMAEIKRWLFGQDGWKTFRCLDDRQDYHLKCILEPMEDIVDGTAYRGLRCKLHNVSPFWYGDEKSIDISNAKLRANVWRDTGYTWDRWCTFQVDIPEEDCVDMPVIPTIEIRPRRNNNTAADGAWTAGTYFAISNTPAATLDEGKAHTGHDYNIDESSRIQFHFSYMESRGATTYSYTEDSGVYTVSVSGTARCTVTQADDKYKISVGGTEVDEKNVSDYSSLDSSLNKPVTAAMNYLGYRVTSTTEAVYAIDNLTLSTKYAIAKSETYPDMYLTANLNYYQTKPLFKMHGGVNICRIYFGHIYDSITIKYTPVYRLGAF